jgi:WD40 repeat protein/serine/threonine protein kinase
VDVSNPAIKELFFGALDRESPEEVVAYLDEACLEDRELRSRIEHLLRLHHGGGNFLGGASPTEATIDFPPIAERVGTIIGPYKLLEQIGEGGFGVVFMAEQTSPVRRKVALKIIKPGMDTKQVIARFEAERQALALMDHPNIARVFDADATESGRPYFVMELVRGVPITEYCDLKKLTPSKRLKLFVDVCRAVHHAHQKGIIHRDLKPSNVMVTMHDDRPVPKIIDFGVSKAISCQLTEKTLFTAYGQMIGTPMYMSPEQAQLSGLDVDTRSDVYSLGVLLYELMAGATPFDEATFKQVGFDEMRRMIREDEPLPPSAFVCTLKGEFLTTLADLRTVDPGKLSPCLRGEVDWIVMKALEKDRNRRYDSANSLAEDIERYLNDEPVQACPPSALYRFRKFARRNRAALAMASIVGSALLLSVAGLAVSTILISREQRTTANALHAETRAKGDLEQTLKRERRDSYFHRITLAHRELSVDDLGRALELLDECPKDLRQWEWNYLMRLCRIDPLVVRGKAQIVCVAFSPDGERLASAGGDGAIKIWDSKTGNLTQTLDTGSEFVVSVVYHPNGKRLATVGTDQQAKVWDLATGRELFVRPCHAVHTNGAGQSVAFSPDGRLLAAGTEGAANVWEWEKDQLLHSFPGHEKHGISVAFTRKGRLASGSWGGIVRLWDAEAGGKPLGRFPESPKARQPVGAMAFSKDGRWLATASYGRRVEIWDTAKGKLLHTLQHSGLVFCVALSPDGRRLASAGEDKTVRIWDATTGREVLGLRGHTGACGSVAFSPDGRRLASASLDGTIRVWDATPLQGDEGQEALTFTKHSDEIWSVAVSPDGLRVVSAGFNGFAKVWDAETQRVNIDFKGHRQVVFCVAWQPNGQQIASAGRDGTLFSVKVWDAQTGKVAYTIPGGQEFFAAAFSPDGRRLVTGSADRTVQVWDAETGHEVATLGAHERLIRGVAISRDGRRLASLGGDGVVNLWDATQLDMKQDPLTTIGGRVPGPSMNVAISPDGRRVAMGGEDNTVKILDVESGLPLQTLRGHSGDIYTVAFSPDEDGRWVASAGEDSAVKVWDSHTGKLVRSFRGHTGLVSSLTFSLDGRSVVSGSRDHTVKFWDVPPLEAMPNP